MGKKLKQPLSDCYIPELAAEQARVNMTQFPVGDLVANAAVTRDVLK